MLMLNVSTVIFHRGRSMFAHKPHTNVKELRKLHDRIITFIFKNRSLPQKEATLTCSTPFNTVRSCTDNYKSVVLKADRFVCSSLFPLALLVRFAVWLWRRPARKASELSLWPHREPCQGFEIPLHKYTSRPESSGLHLPLTTQTCRRCWQENGSPSLRWSGYDTRQAFLMQCGSTLWGKVCLMLIFVQLNGTYTSTLPQYLCAGEELR